ncbi:MAG: thioredoxin family protein [Coriobacteriia bacterium]|nr:thioredoxin family protein [Coriobacteriia bacterium]
MKPLVEGLEKQYSDKVEFRRLNVETDQAAIELANKMGVQYVPTFVFANSNGIVSKNIVGAMTQENMKTSIEALN